ncbi:hypothetical protein IFM89_031131 [Coptis chinensis]|uniref:Cation/H+ exchanger domain-containing protein n=1 Tax=Coptis chinensis TaxID=261450 RepID=A0A835M795_9MAGN|nr:hypothetical protein IFM89_031131 [Coptis chinensis]
MAGFNIYQSNITQECDFIYSSASLGIFNNPFKFSFPLLEFQLFIASFTSIITSVLLKPLGMPTTVSQIIAFLGYAHDDTDCIDLCLGGMLLGPSFLGRFQTYLHRVFPFLSFIVIDTYAVLGTIFQIFLIGVRLNPMMVLRAGRKSQVIGVLVVILPLALSVTCACLLTSITQGNDKLNRPDLWRVGAAQSMSAFPVIACYLTELNILNTEFSNAAFSSSLVSGLLCFSLVTTYLTLNYARNKLAAFIMVILLSALVAMLVVFILRPAIIWMIKQIPAGHVMKEEYLCAVFIVVIMLAFLCRSARLHILFGPFLFGVIIPSGPPLGSALVERLEFFNTWMIMPMFYTEHGLNVNLFDVELTSTVLVESIILISCTGKFLGAFLPALYYSMSYKDATLLGLTMNAQGFLELSFFKTLMDAQVLDRKSFEILCGSMVVITGACAPLVRYLHTSSTKYKLHSRRTIQHSQSDTELRVLACIHDQENVPSIIHLLKASNPTKEIPINVSIIHFVELVGRASPILISHKVNKKPSAATACSQKIINVFKLYEETTRGSILLHPYTVVSSYAAMHNDVCMLAHHKRTSLIILPFHKVLATGVTNGGIKTMNSNVLDKAPCSVGILIDRGLLGGIKFVVANWLSYHVAVVFVGGPDDREALAFVTRMSEHPTIEVTVIRFLSADNRGNDTAERSLDEEAVTDFKFRTAYNNRATYMEEVVKDGLGVINVIELLGNKYELIVLGRRHDDSPLIFQLTDWDKCSELGILGDTFLLSDYGGMATILVVQQQTTVALSSSTNQFQDNDQ